jgi:fatty-acyl-CoA synthase
MGLIGFVLAPLVSRTPVTFFPTEHFLRRPSVWMETMHRERGTITFGPNFAFALAARHAKDVEALSLGHVRVIGCGAEPIVPDTIDAFVRAYASAGLRSDQIVPCYGMAEATLAVSFSGPGRSPRIDGVDPDAYQSARAAKPVRSSSTRFVSCGRPLGGHRVRVIDEEGRTLPERQVGELVVEGASVCPSYFENEEASRPVFRADGLHTGDLGYIAEGEIFVTGRKKDTLVFHGRNYDPQFIEACAEAVEGARLGHVVAFSTPGEQTEALVIAVELRTPSHADRIVPIIRRAIAAGVGLTPKDVVALRPGALPKTTSGKLQRNRTRELYLSGVLGSAKDPVLPANGEGS